MLKQRTIQGQSLVFSALATDVRSVEMILRGNYYEITRTFMKTYQLDKSWLYVRQRFSEVIYFKPNSSYLDEDCFHSRTYHFGEQFSLIPLPQVAEGSQTKTAATIDLEKLEWHIVSEVVISHMFDTHALIIGQDSTNRHALDFRMMRLKKGSGFNSKAGKQHAL